MEQIKEFAFIGLGRMGLAMTTHLVEQGYTIHGFDVDGGAREAAQAAGVTSHDSIESAINALPEHKVVWIMVPSRFVDTVIASVRKQVTKHDIIIDGGNSFFKDSLHRHHALDHEGIWFVDVGTSGGVEGARCGASLMVGGDKEAVDPIAHIFTDLAAEDGYGFVGGPGAGHFVKMIHNGIEYGMMGALAEGVNILHEHEDGLEINVMEALKAYEHGSIISSALTSWLVDAYETPGYLEKIAGVVPRGETEMEMEYVVDHNHARVLNAALTQRKLTRVEPSRTGSLISAMRNQFGGHKTITDTPKNGTEK